MKIMIILFLCFIVFSGCFFSKEDSFKLMKENKCDSQECISIIKDALMNLVDQDTIASIISLPYLRRESIAFVDNIHKVVYSEIVIEGKINIDNYIVYEKNSLGKYGLLEEYIDNFSQLYISKFIIKNDTIPFYTKTNSKHEYYPYTWGGILAYKVSYKNKKELLVVSAYKPPIDHFYPVNMLFYLDTSNDYFDLLDVNYSNGK